MVESPFAAAEAEAVMMVVENNLVALRTGWNAEESDKRSNTGVYINDDGKHAIQYTRIDVAVAPLTCVGCSSSPLQYNG
jgi:hypothetical protein